MFNKSVLPSNYCDLFLNLMLVKQFTFKLILISEINNTVNSDSWFGKENAFGKLSIKR